MNIEQANRRTVYALERAQIAQELRRMRAELAHKWRVRKACGAHNVHTCPWVPRSEWSHACHRRAARKVRAWLQANAKPEEWFERESGVFSSRL